MSYAVQLQPLPPNTGMTLVVDVAGTTKADDAFWAIQCNTIPVSTLFIVVDLGAARDFFKPTGSSTYCEMLQARDKHQWSSDGVTWITPDFNSNSNTNGGSAGNWPIVNGDERQHLSFWGHDGGSITGGGCSSTNPKDSGNGATINWGQACA